MLDKVAQFCTPFVQTTIIISELTPYSSTAIIQPNPIPRAHTHRKTKRVANAALFVLWRYGTRMGPFFSSLTRTRSLRSLGGLRPLSPSGFAPIRFTCVLTQNETTPLRHFKKFCIFAIRIWVSVESDLIGNTGEIPGQSRCCISQIPFQDERPLPWLQQTPLTVRGREGSWSVR